MPSALPPRQKATAAFQDIDEKLQLAQRLAEQLTIGSMDWHRLKSNRRARALEQAATAIVYLLKNQPDEALIRLQQAVGWLDKTISAPPCPTHGDRTPPQQPPTAIS